MKAWSRAERVAKLVSQILADRLAKGTSDAALEGVVIIGTEMAGDIKSATVYFRILDPQDDGNPERVQGAQEALTRASYMLHQELCRQMKIKFVPVLRFRHDVAQDRIHRLESIFQELEEERSRDDES